jgi:LDH2 family malate/lactate/ureidoglycolate dehydrogenase
MPLAGGAEPLLGTNPLAIAIPAGEEPPLVLDIATSIVSYGTIKNHKLQNRPLQDDWMIDPRTGEAVTDPRKSIDALLLPMAGYKGAGLALMLGLLAGTLNGALFGRDCVDFNADPGAVTNTGQFVVALDPSRFQPLEHFKAEVDRHVRSLRNSEALPGGDAVRLPGDARARRRADRMSNGLALPPELLTQLDKLAAELRIAPLRGRA